MTTPIRRKSNDWIVVHKMTLGDGCQFVGGHGSGAASGGTAAETSPEDKGSNDIRKEDAAGRRLQESNGTPSTENSRSANNTNRLSPGYQGSNMDVGRQRLSPMRGNEPELHGHDGGDVQVRYTFAPSPVFRQVTSPCDLIPRSHIPRGVENLLVPSTLSKLVPGVLTNASEADAKKWTGKCEEYRDKAYVPEQSQGESVVHKRKNEKEIHDNDNGNQQHPHPGDHRQDQADPEDPDPEADESDPESSYYY